MVAHKSEREKMGADLSKFVWCVSASIALVFAAILLSDEDEGSCNVYSTTSKNVCASCGIAEVDGDRKECGTCETLACAKRVSDSRDEILFKHPPSTNLGDCPICCLPLSYDLELSSVLPCCCQMICYGCQLANEIREKEEKIKHKCPFCRHPAFESMEGYYRSIMKRVEANDPVAMQIMGTRCYHHGRFDSAFQYLTKAAAMNNAEAQYQLSNMYGLGQGVEMDEEKETLHLEAAAIGGHPVARYNLAMDEWENGRLARAIKHLTIAASNGYDPSLKHLKQGYVEGHISKEDFAAALRAHQAVMDAKKSPQREAAEATRHFVQSLL